MTVYDRQSDELETMTQVVKAKLLNIKQISIKNANRFLHPFLKVKNRNHI